MTFNEYLNTYYSNRDLSEIAGIQTSNYNKGESDKLTDLNGIEQFVNLKGLYIHNNLITDISQVSSLQNLIFFNCYNNLITDLSPLSQLTNLTYIDCGINKVNDLSPLKNLTNLINLQCEDNDIENIVDIRAIIKNLQSFTFRNNPIYEKYKGLDLDDIIKKLNIESRKLKIEKLFTS